MPLSIEERIAQELHIHPAQVHATMQLLDGGATVPFIARYRKEATQGKDGACLDDTQLRNLEERLAYLRDLEERRTAILGSITEQNKLTPELEASIREAETKIRLEDLYRPYKPKRRTKGQIAIEAGLLGLADGLLADQDQIPETLAANFIDAEKGVLDVEAALTGARYILMERFSEDPDLIGKLRAHLEEESFIQSAVIPEKLTSAQKFQDYFEHSELWKKVPSHRCLAMLRGRREGFLQLSIVLPKDLEGALPRQMIAQHYDLPMQNKAASTWFQEVVRMTWRVKIHAHLETELLGRLREQAEEEAIGVFRSNLYDLLMAAPAGAITTLGLDPGLRSGVKLAIVDTTGKLLATETIYPHVPHKKWDASLATLAELISKHDVKLISIGNGTASRETEKLAEMVIRAHPDKAVQKVVTSEAGASVYSASELAAKEFPSLDVTLRGAVSIARRVQDPLAELVKIDPKAIGVGQYQHDVNQSKLAHALEAVVEDAVNAVGVDVNTASAALLSHVAGLNTQIAHNIIEYREKNGAFAQRETLKKVSRLGEKAFEQCAGFLRIMHGTNPLDASCVHPEAYTVIERISAHTQRALPDMIGNRSFLQSLNPADFVTPQFGLPTIIDILKELEKPGRDPRATFKTAQFKEGVENVNDLQADMILEGVITNVTNFGAFVDIGVHQDGLVHISALSNKFIKDPRDVVKTGQIVQVKVLEVDKARQRISLTLCLDKPTEKPAAQKGARSEASDRGHAKNRSADRSTERSSDRSPERTRRSGAPAAPALANGAMGFALLAALKGKSS